MGEIILIKKTFNRIYTSLLDVLSDERGVIVLFFLVLFSALFIGDGKHPIVDIFLSGYIVFFGLYWFLAKKKLKPLPVSVTWLWFATIVYTFIRTVTSDSVGYSLYTLNRFVLAYLVFHFFYTIGSGKTVRFFYYALLSFVVSATAVSAFMMLFPAYGRNLPLMNLVYPNYGHNYLAYLLVFLVPIAVQRVVDRHRFQDYALLIFVAVALILTFARGAWLLVALYAGFLVVFQKRAVSGRQRLLFTGISVILLGLFIGLFNFNIDKTIPTPYTNIALEQFLIKETPIQNRIEYWRQAAGATIERPLFGSGPGTFYLESKRLQSAPLSYSWFAHSFPLQTLTEFGFVGSCLIFWLMYQVIAFIIQRLRVDRSDTKKYAVPLLWGMLLTFGYSIYEFNLDFLVVWLLFFAGLGLLMGLYITENSSRSNQFKFLFVAVFACVMLFYCTSVSSMVADTVWKNRTVAFFLAPYRTDTILQDMTTLEDKKRPISYPYLQIIQFFHMKDSEMLFALGQLMEKENIFTEAERFYKQASHLDAYNIQYYKQYYKFLASLKKTDLLGEEMLQLSKRALPVRFHKQIGELVPYAHALGEYYANWIVHEDPSYKHGYAGLFYRLGISDLRDVEPMEQLLVLARDIYPDLGVLHIELAAYDYHIKNNRQKAREVLILCQSIPSPSRQCKERLQLPLPMPSEYKDVIW